MYATLAPTFAIQDLEERTAARKALIAPGGATFKKMELIDKLLSSTSTKFYLGDDISFADIVWFVNTLGISNGCAFMCSSCLARGICAHNTLEYVWTSW